MELVVDTSARHRRAAVSWFLLAIMLAFAGIAGTLSSRQAFAQEDTDASAKPAEAADTGAAPATPSSEKSFLTWLIDASGPFGLLIGIESFILVALIVMGVMQFRRDSFVPTDFVAAFEEKLGAKDYMGALEVAKNDESLLGRMMAAAMGKLTKGYDEAVSEMGSVLDDENMALDHRLSYTSLIGTTAPMLGLLGTVQGMVGAFSVIARSATSPKPSELAEGITLALVTTLEGLIVAIPAVIGYNLLKNRKERLLYDAGSAAEALMAKYFSNLGRKPAAPAAPTAQA